MNKQMRSRIFLLLLLFSVVGVVSACVLTLSITIRYMTDQAERNVCDMAQTVGGACAYMNEKAYTGILSALPGEMRATLITPEGEVLYDSDASAAQMENHLNRPEIRDALQYGEGEDTRKSTTLHASAYYYAVQLSDGRVLRLARRYSSIRNMVLSSIPGVVAVMLVLFVLAFVLSKRLARWTVHPVEQAVRRLEQDGEGGATYDELTPFVSHIQRQNRELSDQRETLKQEREILGAITNSMREGLMLISEEKNVVSINPSAIRMLNGRSAHQDEFQGHNYLIVNRSEQLYTCVERALTGESSDVLLTMHGKIFHIYASPMIRFAQVRGVVVIVLDETQQRLAERSRQEFSANVSHELKTPLTSISGYAEMMENGMVGSMEDVRTFSGSIHKEALRLIALIEDIIQLSRIEEAPKQAEKIREPIDLNELCAVIVESLQPIADSSAVSLQVSGHVPVIPGEDAMLSEMVYNLCENAIKYNRKNGHVWVTLTDCPDEVELCIRDDGIGIPEDAQPRVFERFYRVDKSRSKQIGGTGLGLSIVKHVVEYHDGRVELDSTPGIGTEIRVYLPK